MKINCIHGYFKFEETLAGQLSKFVSLFGLEIERAGDHFTFAGLVEAPRFSIAGGTYLGAPAIETFEGDPWDVMRANELVYDFELGLVVPIASVAASFNLDQAGNFFITSGMILPGAVTDDGSRVTDYAAFFSPDRMNFKYSEVAYV